MVLFSARCTGNVSVCRRKQPHTSPVAWPSPTRVKQKKGAPYRSRERLSPFSGATPFQRASFSRCRKRPNLIGFVPAPEWRNGRRGGLKNHWLTPCGFESHLRHQLHAKGNPIGFPFSFPQGERRGKFDGQRIPPIPAQSAVFKRLESVVRTAVLRLDRTRFPAYNPGITPKPTNSHGQTKASLDVHPAEDGHTDVRFPHRPLPPAGACLGKNLIVLKSRIAQPRSSARRKKELWNLPYLLALPQCLSQQRPSI